MPRRLKIMWWSTVRVLRNSCAATSRLVAPSTTSRAICSCRAVSTFGGAHLAGLRRLPGGAQFGAGLLEPGRRVQPDEGLQRPVAVRSPCRLVRVAASYQPSQYSAYAVISSADTSPVSRATSTAQAASR
jgi:hypothetical protein